MDLMSELVDDLTSDLISWRDLGSQGINLIL
jgi:hypothetical protein